MNHAPTVTWRTVGFSLSSASSQRSQLEIPRILSRISKTAPHNWWSYGSCRQSHVLAPRHRLKSYSATTTWTQQELGIAQWTSRQLCLAGTQRGQRQYSTGSDDFGKLTELEYRAYPDKPKSLPNAELAKIYGKKIPKQLGNELLQILQKQRVTGTLDYDVELHGANDNLIASGLSWLRKNYPLDEDAAIIKRIEREERSQEAELIARGERLGLYKPQQNTKDGNVYGESQIENLRKENEAKWEAERKAKADREKAEAEAAVARGGKPGGLVKSPKSRAILEKQKKDREWVQHYYEKAKLSKHTSLDQLQKMSKTERLLPSAVFVAVIVAGALFCAAIYKPPPSAARIFSDTPPAIATVTAMMALNTLAWLAWKQPRFWLFMNRYFLMSVATPHPFSLLGNVFSHMSVRHLAMNMVMMWFIGTQLHDDIGRGRFLALYVSSGVLSSLASLTTSVLRNNLLQTSLGASGAVCGVVGCYLLLHAEDRLRFIFWPGENAPTIKGMWVFAFMCFWEVVGLRQRIKKVDHVAHLGGIATGVVASELIKYRARVKRAQLEGQAKIGKLFGNAK